MPPLSPVTDEIHERYLQKAITEINELGDEITRSDESRVPALGSGHPLADIMLLKFRPQTVATLKAIIAKAGTIVWNGPVGVFEFDAFGEGTRELAHAIADSKAFSIAGGGDTLAAIAKYGVAYRISYISTGGGAFLEFLEGKTLPAVAILEQRAAG